MNLSGGFSPFIQGFSQLPFAAEAWNEKHAEARCNENSRCDPGRKRPV